MSWSADSGHSTQAATLTCPRCGSGNARTLRVIHESGTISSSGTAHGWTQGSGSSAGHSTSYSTSSTSQSTAAKAATPPKKRHNGAVLLGFGFTIAVAAIIYYIVMTTNQISDPSYVAMSALIAAAAGFVMLVIGLVLAPADSRYNSDVFPEAFREWDRTWSCQQCGTRFHA